MDGRLSSEHARQMPMFTIANLRWVIRHRAWTPWYLKRYWRFFVFRIRNPHIITEGMVFFGKGVEVTARKGYGRLVIGRWVHFGELNRIRCHEGSLRIGDKTVFGRDNTVNCYLDIEIGPATLISDWVYICDFDHATRDVVPPIRDQGIVKAPVRIGGGSWLGTKVSVLRGAEIGVGTVVAAHAVVRGATPDRVVLAGVPAKVVKCREQDSRDGWA
jgi:acetyltransferase-like isoleucine patch superfamily enzyme